MISAIKSAVTETVGFLFDIPAGNAIGYLQCDATLSTNHSWANEIADHRVEDGLPVSDFIRHTPDRLTISGFIGNGNSGEFFTWVFSDDGAERVQNGFDLLKKMAGSDELVTVNTNKHAYTDMGIVSVEVSETKETYNSLQFTIELKHARKVSLQLAEVPKGIGKKTAGSMKGKTETPKNGGNQGTGVEMDKPSDKISSSVKGAADYLFGGK